jgi:hypothetical protein
MTIPSDPFVVYSMADGSEIDEFSWVTELEWFEGRDREVRLIKSTFKLISRELVVLPDPYPIEEEDEEAPVFPPPA